MRRVILIPLLALLASLAVAAPAAQAFVLSDGGNQYGVAYVPGTHPVATGSGSCTDPWLAPDLSLPNTGLCWHGGDVLNRNQTFDLTWDPDRRYWSSTRDYVEQFLQDVATGSGTLTSPYALTTQYSDPSGRAANASLYGGGCIDYGPSGGFTCRFGDITGSGSGGEAYASTNDCTVSGTNQFAEAPDGTFGNGSNDICVTDADIRAELQTIVPKTGLTPGIQSGYRPVLVLPIPAGVEVCLDSTSSLCSANSNASTRFCSYHSNIEIGGVDFAYIVQPWTASWHIDTGCDEPDAPQIPDMPTPQQLATDVGARLVSPLSQGQIAAIANPDFTGWYALNDSEINDNGCQPLPDQFDQVTVGTSAQNPYFLQREFNNAGVIETDPNAPACAPDVLLAPTFVVPSQVSPHDEVQFDGSTTVSTLIVPNKNYFWNFGDDSGAIGPSVVHSYAAGGSYQVTLTVIDRGGNAAVFSQIINVGKPGAGQTENTALRARLQLLPQGLRDVLRKGVVVVVSSNQPADGIATLLISRQAARRAHIRLGRGATVVVGRGSITGIKDGTVTLHIHVSRALAAKLSRLHHVTLTLRLKLITANRGHLMIDAAGRY